MVLDEPEKGPPHLPLSVSWETAPQGAGGSHRRSRPRAPALEIPAFVQERECVWKAPSRPLPPALRGVAVSE